MRKEDVAVAVALILERCAVLSQCSERAGEICRTFLSPAMEEAHARLRAWMRHADLAVQLDRAGNILASTPATAGAPRLLIGSHLDTVPDAGAYDGVFGVVMALSMAEAQRGRRRRFALEVVGFSEEEGVRFNAPFLGSKMMAGGLGPQILNRIDATGVTLAEAFEQFEKEHPAAIAPRVPRGTRGYLEFHIEQGPVLESLCLPLGVVTAIAGQTRGTMTFVGKAGHAGTTPMHQRQDALSAAAEWIGQLEQLAHATEGLMGTIGRISVQPNAINVIPGESACGLDLRHADDGVRDLALSKILHAAEQIATRRGIKCNWNQTHTQAAVPMDNGIIEIAERAIERAGYPVHRMVSGAGHDAMVLAPHVPSGMIFVRSPGGVSHHPEEKVLTEDVTAAFYAGLNFLDEFERAVCSGERTADA